MPPSVPTESPRAALSQQRPGTYDHVLVGRVHGVNDRDLREKEQNELSAPRRPLEPQSIPPAQPGQQLGPVHPVPCPVPGVPCPGLPGPPQKLRSGPAPGRRQFPAPLPPAPGPPPVPGPSPPHHGGGGPAELPARPLPALRRGTPVPRTTGPAAPRPPATTFRSCRVPGAAAAGAGQGEGEGRERGLACPAPGTRAERPGARPGPAQNPQSRLARLLPPPRGRPARSGAGGAPGPQSAPPWPASRTTSPACWRK